MTSPRAFVHRSHSGHYGIVNSEDGYQNLTRFLFGELRVDGILDIDDITLPVEVQNAHDDGKKVRVVPVRSRSERFGMTMLCRAPAPLKRMLGSYLYAHCEPSSQMP